MSIYQGDEKIKHIEVPTSGRNIDHFLPSAYQEVEYIESSGTQYIDTGISVNDGTGVSLEMSWEAYQGEIALLGTRSSSDYYYIITNANSALGFRIGQIATSYTDNTLSINAKHTISMNMLHDGKCYYDGELVTTKTYNPFSINNTMVLFAQRFHDGAITTKSSYKMYSCKFNNNSALIRNFIPAKRKSDNEVGLYDTVNNQFYTNQGTGSFTAGPNIVSDKIERAYATDNSGVPSLVFADRLPDELQEVRHLESTGTQYIDTGFIASINSKIDITMRAKTNNNGAFIASRGAAYNPQFGLWFSQTSQLAANYGEKGDTGWLSEYTLSDKMHNVVLNKNELYYDGSLIYTFTDPAGVTNNLSLYIFCLNNNNNTDRFTSIIFYSCKLYNTENTLARNFVPCYIKTGKTFVDEKGVTCSAGTPGLYDLVNGVFYTNSGTGTFSVGEDV